MSGRTAAREARDALLGRWVRALPKRPRLVDLSRDAGAALPELAPLLGGAQVWSILAADPEEADEALAMADGWAADEMLPTSWTRRALLIHTEAGAWRIEANIDGRDDPAAIVPALRPDAIVIHAEPRTGAARALARLAAAARCAVLCLNMAETEMRWTPPHPHDRLVRHGVRRIARRHGAVPGPAEIAGTLSRAGMRVSTAHGWERASAATPELLDSVLRTQVGLARLGLPGHGAAIDAWCEARLRQQRQRRLVIRVGERDILALPN